jgi:hypothetical protein
MSTTAHAWLAVRGGVPPQLAAVMEDAVDRAVARHTELAGVLAEAARICLVDALDHCDERSAALPLLAADALMTFACEAAADGERAGIAELAESCAPQRLALLLPGGGSRS